MGCIYCGENGYGSSMCPTCEDREQRREFEKMEELRMYEQSLEDNQQNDNPTANSLALTAAELVAKVEAGFELAEKQSVDLSYNYSTIIKVPKDITEGRAAFRLLLTRQQERERRLREFVEKITSGFEADDKMIDMLVYDQILPEELLNLSSSGRSAARALLTELGGDESEVRE